MFDRLEMRLVRFCFCLLFLISCNQESGFQDVSSSYKLASLFSSNLQKESFEFDIGRQKLDIVIIADNSESMFHHLDNLGRSLTDLLYVISDYDWRIGISSADHGDHHNFHLEEKWQDHTAIGWGRFGTLMSLERGGRFINENILTPDTPGYKTVFLHSISHSAGVNCDRPPFCGRPTEQPLRSLKSFIERAHLDNRHFFRDEADFVSLIITNEEERKEDPHNSTSADQVMNAFERQFGQLDKKFLAFNITVLDEACLAEERNNHFAASQVKRVAYLATLTGGANMSLCHKSYKQGLRKISQHIKNSVEDTIELKKDPVPESVQVDFVEGPDLKWKLEGRKLIFENDKREDVSVSVLVTYQAK